MTHQDESGCVPRLHDFQLGLLGFTSFVTFFQHKPVGTLAPNSQNSAVYPTNIILPESGELPLQLRRRWLASKYLLKAVHAKNPIVETITELKIHMAKYGECDILYGEIDMSIWRNLNIPEVVKCSTRIDDLKEQLDCTKIPSCFQTNLMTHYKKLVYTKNASDPQNGGNMGLGKYCPDRNIKLSGSLPGNFSICTSEVAAIMIALNVIKEENIKKSIIFPYSLSASDRISNWKISVHNDEIIDNGPHK
ncbi:hypothetical protein WA026_006479 [Henosepilachna vigintioctopunctata]|uniref:RNase H type-1 domain-containing protein n=1 Tax=Henosepilachna vigintioctopunctata TaxID=420089 RepID=A0AAW1U9R9_9CUCU